jgi:cell division protein FtsL
MSRITATFTFNRILLLIFVFVLCVALAFYFEYYYRVLVVELYKEIHPGQFTFNGKYFQFPGARFVSAFGIFGILLTSFLFEQRKKILKLLISVILFFLSTAVIVYANSSYQLAACTACNDGKLTLGLREIPYDSYFYASLFISLLPVTIMAFKKRKQS